MDYGKVSFFEHTFWLQILGDHARFIFHSLSPVETEYIQQAHQFIQNFDHLLIQARKMEEASTEKWMELSYHSYTWSEQFRIFKLTILQAHLECKVMVSLPPTFFNHVVNEVEEYMRVLIYLSKGEVPPKLHPVHHHNLWIQDGIGHATLVQDLLDPIEKEWRKKAKDFEDVFHSFYLKAKEMAGFLRARQDLFPSLEQFNKRTSLEFTLFQHFLNEIEEMRLQCSSLGVLRPLLADHMARETCYYLIKLHEVDPENIKLSECDPTKPRVE